MYYELKFPSAKLDSHMHFGRRLLRTNRGEKLRPFIQENRYMRSMGPRMQDGMVGDIVSLKHNYSIIALTRYQGGIV